MCNLFYRNIRRIIFHSIEKWSGQDILTLSSSHLKQIAGRAGRYQSQFPDGLVTTFKQEDFQSMKKLFSVPEADIQVCISLAKWLIVFN